MVRQIIFQRKLLMRAFFVCSSNSKKGELLMGNLTHVYTLQNISYSIQPSKKLLISSDFYTLFIVMNGSGKLAIDHDTIHFSEEKCILIPPNNTVSIHIQSEHLCFISYNSTLSISAIVKIHIVILQVSANDIFSLFTMS